MSSSRRFPAFWTLCVALTWGLCVVADDSNRQNENDYFNPDKWSLRPADSEPITSLSDLKSGVYSVQLSGERSGCGLDSKGPEYLGFNNRTCSTKLSLQGTAGPVMRGPSKSMMWREWMIRVVGGGGEGNSNGDKDVYKIISLQAFIPPDVEDEARCLGFVSTFYGNSEFKGTCAIPPYGSALFLNSSRDDSKGSSEMWKIRLVDASKGEFEMIAPNKPDVCLQVLALEDCSEQPSLIENSPPYLKESRKWGSWKLVRRYDLVPNVSPPSSPPPSPPSSPTPVGPAPGPIISAPSTTNSGYVTVRIESNGGDNRCSVSSIILSSIGSAIGSLPQTVEVSVSSSGLDSLGASVPLTQNGYNSIYAVGKCNNGGSTERSNELSVFYAASNELSSPTPSTPPPFTCTGDLVSQTTDWVMRCASMNCHAGCAGVSKSCNNKGIWSVNTEAKARFVLDLFGSYTVTTTNSSADIKADSPSILDNVLYWNGVSSGCPGAANPTNYARMCCCGSNCPVQDLSD